MRILYGVVGEGMGHAMRSRVVLDELTREHDVHVVASGRAHEYLAAREGPRVGNTRIWGYSLVYENNAVVAWRTALRNFRGSLTGVPRNIRAYFEVVDRFAPDLVISDFESWSHLFARRHGIPVISIDNMQIIARCRHSRAQLAGLQREYSVAKALVKLKVRGAAHYHITTFFYPPVSAVRTTLHPPILRPEILAAQPSDGEHLVIYQTSTSNDALPELLKRCGRPCRIYGLKRDLREDVHDGNLTYRPFSERTFVDDLASACGVIANGVFTLMGEAVYLRRPMLAIPIGKQFEQVLNARYLEREGYGLCASRATQARLGEFLERLPEFRERMAGHRQDGNADLFAALARSIAAAVRRG